MDHLRHHWARVASLRTTAFFGNFGAEEFYSWEGKMENRYGSGRRVGDKSADALSTRVLTDYGIDPATVNVVVGVGETYTEFDFSTQRAKVRVSFRNQNTWSLLHELGHVILFHRLGREHESNHHGDDLQAMLIELLDRYSGIRLKPEDRVPLTQR